MNAATKAEYLLPAIGEPFAGGFFAGRFRVAGVLYALVAAAIGNVNMSGENCLPLLARRPRKSFTGAASYCDGLANTRDLAKAGSPAADWALSLDFAGFRDFYLPSRDELELCYRNLKPGVETMLDYAAESNTDRSGENPSSEPIGWPYSTLRGGTPKQTLALAFREEGGKQSFTVNPENPYRSSTLWYLDSNRRIKNWGQYFCDGSQNYIGLDYEDAMVRAVRRVQL